jgi:hypothetical protein
MCNILVVSDPKHPENEGKVKLFKFGKKIFDKIKDVMQPQFADEEPVNPFDFWKGADFKLKIRNVEGYRNYDKSEFDKASAVLDGDDAEIEKIWNQQHSLSEFLADKNFKSYEELKKKLEGVLNAGASSMSRADSVDLDRPVAKPAAIKPAAKAAPIEEEDDESLSYFAKLAADD